ncbi:MAG TPA: PfkB family carbohydrate kinase [Phycisphaerae bacterium]|nr:PfkB family carbohydrate kinase [Phycisphaerae bacterium]
MSASGEHDWLEECLQGIGKGRVTVFGDFCLDAYWLIDPDETERSVETRLPVRRVREQRYGLGGAGNIAANLAALGVAHVRAVGLLASDLFGRAMLEMLSALPVSCIGMLGRQADWQTAVYAKPHVGHAEQNRIDFGAFNVPSADSVEALGRALDRAAAGSDAVILNQQLPGGVSTPAMIERINDVIAARPQCRFIADSRGRAERYRGACLKLNAHEAARVLGETRPAERPVPAGEAQDLTRRLFERTTQPVFLTRGEQGLIVVDSSGLHEIPGVPIAGPTDPVGAGDTAVAAIAAVLGSGGDAVTAGRLANIAASVTVRKLRTTGTATPEEIRRAAASS